MKDLPSKEHYCNKIHIILIKCSAYPPPLLPPTIYRQPPLYGLPPSILLENLDSPCDFSKILTPPINKRAWDDWGGGEGSHYVDMIFKLPTLGELDDVSNHNQSTSLINTARSFRNRYFRCGTQGIS